MWMPDLNNPLCRMEGSRALVARINITPSTNGEVDLEGRIFVYNGGETESSYLFEETREKYTVPKEIVDCCKGSQGFRGFNDAKLMAFLRTYFMILVAKKYPGQLPEQEIIHDNFLLHTTTPECEVSCHKPRQFWRERTRYTGPELIKWAMDLGFYDPEDIAALINLSVSTVRGYISQTKHHSTKKRSRII